MAFRSRRVGEILRQLGFAGEHRGAAGDVEPQPIRRIGCRHRRVAFAPGGEPGQGGFIGHRIGVDGNQRGTDGTRGGQRLAG